MPAPWPTAMDPATELMRELSLAVTLIEPPPCASTSSVAAIFSIIATTLLRTQFRANEPAAAPELAAPAPETAMAAIWASRPEGSDDGIALVALTLILPP